MEHAWTHDDFDKSDEVQWHKQTLEDVGGISGAQPAYANSDPVYGGNGEPTYTYSNQGSPGYNGGGGLIR